MFSSTHSFDPLVPSFPSSPSSYPYPLPFFTDPQNAFASNTLLYDPLATPTPDFTDANCVATVQKITKKAAKKDGHSKIQTSQGLRDRRVRLSSEIARKFFDLQEMLEHDKPSNTIEWLFNKSESAIKELARRKHRCSGPTKCFCFSFKLQEIDDSHGNKILMGITAKERKLETKKARERRRDSTGRVEDRLPEIANSQIQQQLMPTIHPQVCASARWPKLVHHHPDDHLLGCDCEASRSDDFDNVIIIKDEPVSMSIQYSTELQILGKSWEECTNQCLGSFQFPNI